MTDVQDYKDARIFKNVRLSPEIPQHKRRWDAKRCKRNKGLPHDMQLVREELMSRPEFRGYNIDGWHVTESRPYQAFDREWRCTHCGKKEVSFAWSASAERVYTGEWSESWRSKRPKK